MTKFNNIVDFIKKTYNTTDFIPLHEPRFIGNEKKYLNECIDSTFVSSVGKFVDLFEKMITEYTGSKYSVAAVNGTNALHIALMLSGVKQGDEVITQALTFIATANAISYCGANPVFIDVDKETLGLSHEKLEEFLSEKTYFDKSIKKQVNKHTKRPISACLPMHTFGHPAKIDKIVEICDKYNIPVIEDAAESLGSIYKNQHTGTFGKFGILSFNGNKTITTGGGGMILTNDQKLAKLAKHLTTQAKIPHRWEYAHDYVGYNYRLTNLQAALGVAQMESLPKFIENKRKLAKQYNEFFSSIGIKFVTEPKHSKSNYWLNAIELKNLDERNKFLETTNNSGVMTRPIWKLMNKLPMFKDCQAENLENSEFFEQRVVNIPSSVIL